MSRRAPNDLIVEESTKVLEEELLFRTFCLCESQPGSRESLLSCVLTMAGDGLMLLASRFSSRRERERDKCDKFPDGLKNSRTS